MLQSRQGPKFTASRVLYKYNMILREVVEITGPEVLDASDYFPTRQTTSRLVDNFLKIFRQSCKTSAF